MKVFFDTNVYVPEALLGEAALPRRRNRFSPFLNSLLLFVGAVFHVHVNERVGKRGHAANQGGSSRLARGWLAIKKVAHLAPVTPVDFQWHRPSSIRVCHFL
jgi:hypothetical protein